MPKKSRSHMPNPNLFGFITLLCFTLLLTACGKTDAEEVFPIEPVQFTYIPDDAYLAISGESGFVVTQNIIDMDEFRFINNNFIVSGDFLFITNGYRLRRINLNDNTHITGIFSGIESDVSLSNLAQNSQGNILLLQGEYRKNSGLKYHLYEITANFADGQNITAKYITDISTTLNLKADCFVQGIYSDQNDNLYFRIYNKHDGYTLTTLDSDMNLLGRINRQNHITDVFSASDGMVYFIESIGAGTNLYLVEISSGNVGPEVTLDGILMASTYIRLATMGTMDFLYSADQNLWEFDPSTGNNTKILSWIDLGFDSTTLGGFGRLSDGSIWLLDQVSILWGPNFHTDYELITLSPAAFDPNTPRINITYGIMEGRFINDIEKAMMEFNRTNPFIRVSLKKYSDFQSFANDIILTNEPDIISLSSFNYNALAAKGVLADLNPYLDIAGINRADYLPNILDKYEKDGKLYGILYNFQLGGLIGRSDILLDIERFTVEELIRFAEQHPAAKLWNATAESTLRMLVSESLDEFINWESGKCHFDSEKFIKVLEFAKTFGNDINHDWLDTDIGFIEGRYLLKPFHIRNLNSFQFITIETGGADLNTSGIPAKTRMES